MTICQMMIERLEGSGMFAQDAAKVLEIAKKTDGLESMVPRWNDDASGYPSQLIPVIWLRIKELALEWIDANCPKAWYREMFVDKPIPTTPA